MCAFLVSLAPSRGSSGAGFYVNATTELFAKNYNMYTYVTEVRGMPSVDGMLHWLVSQWGLCVQRPAGASLCGQQRVLCEPCCPGTGHACRLLPFPQSVGLVIGTSSPAASVFISCLHAFAEHFWALHGWPRRARLRPQEPGELCFRGCWLYSLVVIHVDALCIFVQGKYRSVSAFSPICNPTQCPWGVKAFSGYLGPDTAAWKVGVLVCFGKDCPYAFTLTCFC